MLAPAILLALCAASPSLDGLAAVRSVLQRTEGASTCPDDLLVRRLTALGSEAAPALFTVVTGEAIDDLLGDSEATAWLCAPDRVGTLAAVALGNLPAEAVRQAIRAHCADHPQREIRASAFEILGRQRSADGLALAFELLTASGPDIELRSLRLPAVRAFQAILRADSRAFRTLEAPLLAAPVDQQRLVAEALVASGRGEAVGLLAKLVGHDEELDLGVLDGLTSLAETCPWRLSDDVARSLQKSLTAPNPRLRACAARAAGRLNDGTSAPTLVAMLADGNADVERAASWALGEIASTRRPRSTEEWHAWLDHERDWWQREGSALLASLEQDDGTRLSASLRELQRHPLAHQRVAEVLISKLASLEPAAQTVACSALARIGARDAVPALIELLNAADADAKNAAWNALRALTRQDLPAEPRRWEEFAFD